jgi:transposase
LRDHKGRSLRDFDLKTRIFRYPVSYLIYSDQFDQLPQEAKTCVYHRLYEVLSGADQSPAFQKISAADRTAAYQILLATKPHLPEEWRQSAAAAARAERLFRRRAG